MKKLFKVYRLSVFERLRIWIKGLRSLPNEDEYEVGESSTVIPNGWAQGLRKSDDSGSEIWERSK